MQSNKLTKSFNDIVTSGSLTPESHTRVMQQIMDNAFFILAYLRPSDVLCERVKKPTRLDILEAALKVETVDSYAKDRIKETLIIAPIIAEAITGLTGKTILTLSETLRNINRQPTLQDTVHYLTDLSKDSNFTQIGGVEEGARVAIQLLQDGESTIYNPEHCIYTMFKENDGKGPINWNNLGKADVGGAIVGAAGGCAAGAAPTAGAGCIPTAIGAGIGAALLGSAGSLFNDVWDGIFGDSDGIPEGDLGDFPIPGGGDRRA